MPRDSVAPLTVAWPGFAKDYAHLLDGVLFPYRDESHGGNFKSANYVETEVKNLRSKFGPNVPIVVGVFASRHSKLGLPSTDYVEEGLGEALGRQRFCLQAPAQGLGAGEICDSKATICRLMGEGLGGRYRDVNMQVNEMRSEQPLNSKASFASLCGEIE